MYSRDTPLGSQTFINGSGILGLKSPSPKKLVRSVLDPPVATRHSVPMSSSQVGLPLSRSQRVWFLPFCSELNNDTDSCCARRLTVTWRRREEAGRSCRDASTAASTSTARGRSTKRYKLIKLRGNSSFTKLRPRLHVSFQMHVAPVTFGVGFSIFQTPHDSKVWEHKSKRKTELFNMNNIQ